MDMEPSNDILRVGYSGSLKGYRPGSEKIGLLRPLFDWCWTFRNRNLQHHTRSGYFLLKALSELKKRYPESAQRIRLDMWGLIDPLHADQVRQMGLEEMVNIEGYFPKAESDARLQTCDLLFLPLETSDDPLFIPGKVFEYIKIGKPVLVLGPTSDCSRILERAGLGIQFDPKDTGAIVDGLVELMEQKDLLPSLYEADSDYVKKNFHFQNIAQQMAGVFEEVLKNTS